MPNEKTINRVEKAITALMGAIEKAGGYWSIGRPEGGLEVRISIPKKKGV